MVSADAVAALGSVPGGGGFAEEEKLEVLPLLLTHVDRLIKQLPLLLPVAEAVNGERDAELRRQRRSGPWDMVLCKLRGGGGGIQTRQCWNG